MKEQSFYEEIISKIEKMSSFEIFVRIQKVYEEIEECNSCEDENKDFLIAYMMSGMMNEDDLDVYDSISSKHPDWNLPNSLDY